MSEPLLPKLFCILVEMSVFPIKADKTHQIKRCACYLNNTLKTEVEGIKRSNLDLAEATGEAFLQVGNRVKKVVFCLLLFAFGYLTHPIAACCVKSCSAQSCGDRKNKYST